MTGAAFQEPWPLSSPPGRGRAKGRPGAWSRPWLLSPLLTASLPLPGPLAPPQRAVSSELGLRAARSSLVPRFLPISTGNSPSQPQPPISQKENRGSEVTKPPLTVLKVRLGFQSRSAGYYFHLEICLPQSPVMANLPNVWGPPWAVHPCQQGWAGRGGLCRFQEEVTHWSDNFPDRQPPQAAELPSPRGTRGPEPHVLQAGLDQTPGGTHTHTHTHPAPKACFSFCSILPRSTDPISASKCLHFTCPFCCLSPEPECQCHRNRNICLFLPPSPPNNYPRLLQQCLRGWGLQ